MCGSIILGKLRKYFELAVEGVAHNVYRDIEEHDSFANHKA